MKKIMLLILFFYFMNSAQSQTGIKTDGMIQPAEWKNSDSISLQKGGAVRLKKEDGFLYVAFSGDANGWSHVYLQKGDSIFVLHASAALGTGIYILEGSGWKNVQGFQWDFRAMVYNQSVIKLMETHIRKHGWVANNLNMGDKKTLEYKIDLSRFSGLLRVAFVHAIDANEPHYYPAGLKDGTIDPDLVFGKTPEYLYFEPSTWKSLD